MNIWRPSLMIFGNGLSFHQQVVVDAHELMRNETVLRHGVGGVTVTPVQLRSRLP